MSIDQRRINSHGRAVSKCCKAWKETRDWADVVEFVRALQSHRRQGQAIAFNTGTLSDTLMSEQATLPHHDAMELVKAIVLSQLQDQDTLRDMLDLDWGARVGWMD